MKKTIMFVIAFLIIAYTSFAEDCDNAITQSEINQCVGLKRQQKERELADFIKMYKKRLDSSQVHHFKKAQDAWEQYRSTSCEFNTYDTTGGSAHMMEYMICMTEKAKARLSELRALANCTEGDLGCSSTKNKGSCWIPGS
jgi:uncharacterized protein YecT (DUF1311 family)